MRKFVSWNYMGQRGSKSQKQGHAHTVHKAQAGGAGPNVIEREGREFRQSHLAFIHQFCCRRINELRLTTENGLKRGSALPA